MTGHYHGPMTGHGEYPTLTDAQVVDHLRQVGHKPIGVTRVGAGHWSVCYGFQSEGRHLVIRFGHHRDDFERDQVAHRFNSDQLPVPEVLAIGRAFTQLDLGRPGGGCHYAISERVDGVPLETVRPDRWASVVPSVASAMEAMRTVPLPDGVGWGDWASIGDDGLPVGSHRSWRRFVLAVEHEPDTGRLAGWRTRLAANRKGTADFDWAIELTTELLDDDLNDSVRPGITHQDMINRNVHVVDDRLTGVFDWGCAAYTDPIYELALFEFWNPWHPRMRTDLLRAEVEQRWARSGFVPERADDRLLVCYLHIGLTHLMYVAYVGQWENMARIGDRMRQLAAGR